MRHKFKIGDTVVCRDSFGTDLKKGETYKVAGLLDDTDLWLLGQKYSWAAWRFDLTPPAPPANTGAAMSPPVTSAERKNMPLFSGCFNYFPAALMLVAALSKKGNEKHNPGEPLHHARGKSTDHADCISRHQQDVGEIDPDTDFDHAVGVAWRALAQLQELAEKKYGWPKAKGAK